MLQPCAVKHTAAGESP